MKIAQIILCFCLLAECTQAQTPEGVQFFANPVYYNPAYAGATRAGRFAYQYRRQWPALADFQTHRLSWDGFHPLRKQMYGLGSGLLLSYDKAGSIGLETIQIEGIFSGEIILGKYRRRGRRESTWRMRLGMQGGVGQRRLRDPSLIFEDQLVSGGVTAEDIAQIAGQRWYGNLAWGVLLGNHSYWFGVAGNHFNRPRYTIQNSSNSLTLNDDLVRLQRQWTVHGGIKIPLPEVRGGDDLRSIKLEGLYQKQGESHYVTLGGNLNWGFSDPRKKGVRRNGGEYYSVGDYMLTLGLWYRGFPNQTTQGLQTDALTWVGGVHADKVLFTYSYDMTLSSLGIDSGGIHEISLILRILYEPRECKSPFKWRVRKHFPMLKVFN